MIRVLIADDHDLVRAGLRRLLADESDIEIVGEAASGDELLQAVPDARPDVIIIDVSMPGPGVFALLAELRQLTPPRRAIVLSMHPEEEYALRVIRAGAAGYLTKGASASHLVAAVRRAAEGGIYVPATVGELLATEIAQPSTAPLDALSDREREVLQLIAQGSSTKRIAALLSVSPKTVSTYRSRLLEKLRLATTADLIRFAIENEIV